MDFDWFPYDAGRSWIFAITKDAQPYVPLGRIERKRDGSWNWHLVGILSGTWIDFGNEPTQDYAREVMFRHMRIALSRYFRDPNWLVCTLF